MFNNKTDFSENERLEATTAVGIHHHGFYCPDINGIGFSWQKWQENAEEYARRGRCWFHTDQRGGCKFVFKEIKSKDASRQTAPYSYEIGNVTSQSHDDDGLNRVKCMVTSVETLEMNVETFMEMYSKEHGDFETDKARTHFDSLQRGFKQKASKKAERAKEQDDITTMATSSTEAKVGLTHAAATDTDTNAAGVALVVSVAETGSVPVPTQVPQSDSVTEHAPVPESDSGPETDSAPGASVAEKDSVTATSTHVTESDSVTEHAPVAERESDQKRDSVTETTTTGSLVKEPTSGPAEHHTEPPAAGARPQRKRSVPKFFGYDETSPPTPLPRVEDPPPLPRVEDPPPSPKIPEHLISKWEYVEESRVLLGDFKHLASIPKPDKEFLLSMMERDDITVVTEGIVGNFGDSEVPLGSIATPLHRHSYHDVLRYDRIKSHGDTWFEEGDFYSMTLGDFVSFLEKKLVSGGDRSFEFEDDKKVKHGIDNVDDVVFYLIDCDMNKNHVRLRQMYLDQFKVPEILPGSKFCMLNAVSFIEREILIFSFIVS